MNNHISYQKNRNFGFTLAELLIVVAIITVLAGIAIPIFSRQKENAANAVDVDNAKTIASQLEYYYMSNPDAVSRLYAIWQESPGAMEIIVTPTGTFYSTHTNHTKGCLTADDQAVEADMKAALGDYDSKTKSGDQYSSTYKCQSTKTWKQYAVIISCWVQSTRKPADYPNIYYCAWADSAEYDGGYSWDNIVSTSSYNTSFKNKCGGDRVLQ